MRGRLPVLPRKPWPAVIDWGPNSSTTRLQEEYDSLIADEHPRRVLPHFSIQYSCRRLRHVYTFECVYACQGVAQLVWFAPLLAVAKRLRS